MFSKNNLKYIFILALGFFWCSSLYLTQEQYLLQYTSVDVVNLVELLFGSFAMAFGIFLFAILARKVKNIKKYYLISILLSVICSLLFFMIKNVVVMSIMMCLTCVFSTAGFGVGYHFSILSEHVSKEYRGRVFALGYGIGSIGTYLVILLPEWFYSSMYSFILYIPALIINLILVLKLTRLDVLSEEENHSNLKKYFLKISFIVLAMSLLSALSTDAIAIHTIDIPGGYGATRLYYCLGLFIAGFLADKKQTLFEIFVIVSFIFSLLAVILLMNGYSISIIAALSYSFVAFFVLFRTITFVNLYDYKKSMIVYAAFGLMYSRMMEGLMVLFEDELLQNHIVLIIVISIVLSFVILLYFFLYFEHKKTTNVDIVKELAIKYHLSLQEEKVLKLLIEGKTNQEMADLLFVSLYTIKNHVASIYKKTKMKKKELIEICYFGTI